MKVGEPTPAVLSVPACDTPDQMRDVMNHGKKGKKALLARLTHYNKQLVDGVPACGEIVSQVFILAVLYTEKIENQDVTVFVFLHPTGAVFVGITTLKIENGTPV